MSAVATIQLPITGTNECPQCDSVVRHEDITITTPKAGLGKPKRQHVEAHCRSCRAVIVFDMVFEGMDWRRVGKFEVISLEQQKARHNKKRADLEHAIHYASDHEFSGSEAGNHGD
jgi:hypothetical protein